MPLEIEVNNTTWEIKIVWNSGHLSIPGASAISYPATQNQGPESKSITLDVDVLVSGINKTIFATADDELRPVMNGVYFDFQQLYNVMNSYERKLYVATKFVDIEDKRSLFSVADCHAQIGA